MQDKSLSVDDKEEYPLKIEGVWKTYDGNQYILKDINLKVTSKDITLITGRSGSGKTTLLNLIGCIDIPSKGRICLNGYDTGMMSQRELAKVRLRKIGMVFQTHNLIGDLNVLENVMLPLKIASEKNARDNALELLEIFELTRYRDRFPSEISGGERQRVAVSRALANKPAVLLADEPTASLDKDNSEIVIEAFKRANRELKTSVIIASHDPLLQRLFPEKYVLVHGELILAGEGKELFE